MKNVKIQIKDIYVYVNMDAGEMVYIVWVGKSELILYCKKVFTCR